MIKSIAKIGTLISVFVITFSKPWDSVSKNENWWITRHEKFFKETSEWANKIQVVFFGDSITEGWAKKGEEVWNKYYGENIDMGIHAVNYGIGGDKTENLIWRINNGEFDGLTLKLIVVKIGTNNLAAEPNDDDIVKGITAVVDGLHNKTAQTKILLLGILPRSGEELQARIKNINSHIKGLDGRYGLVWFLDMWGKYIDVNSPSRLNDDLFEADKLHLAKPGYQVWAETMDPLFRKLYNSSYSAKFSIFNFIFLLLFIVL